MRALLLLLMMASFAWAAAPPTGADCRTSFVVYPADTNHMGSLFGGKTFGEMDRAAGIAARRLLRASPVKAAVTVSANVCFHNAARVGDLAEVAASVSGVGEKSILVRVVVMRDVPGSDYPELVASGVFVFVAYDPVAKRAVPHGLGGKKP